MNKRKTVESNLVLKQNREFVEQLGELDTHDERMKLIRYFETQKVDSNAVNQKMKIFETNLNDLDRMKKEGKLFDEEADAHPQLGRSGVINTLLGEINQPRQTYQDPQGNMVSAIETEDFLETKLFRQFYQKYNESAQRNDQLLREAQEKQRGRIRSLQSCDGHFRKMEASKVGVGSERELLAGPSVPSDPYVDQMNDNAKVGSIQEANMGKNAKRTRLQRNTLQGDDQIGLNLKSETSIRRGTVSTVQHNTRQESSQQLKLTRYAKTDEPQKCQFEKMFEKSNICVDPLTGKMDISQLGPPQLIGQMLMNTRYVKYLSSYEFSALLSDTRVREELQCLINQKYRKKFDAAVKKQTSKKYRERIPGTRFDLAATNQQFDDNIQNMIKQILIYSDRELYSDFVDGNLSLDQTFGRLSSGQPGQVYEVLDDFKGKINPEILYADNPMLDHLCQIMHKQPGLQESLADSALEEKCFRSLFWVPKSSEKERNREIQLNKLQEKIVLQKMSGVRERAEVERQSQILERIMKQKNQVDQFQAKKQREHDQKLKEKSECASTFDYNLQQLKKKQFQILQEQIKPREYAREIENLLHQSGKDDPIAALVLEGMVKKRALGPEEGPKNVLIQDINQNLTGTVKAGKQNKKALPHCIMKKIKAKNQQIDRYNSIKFVNYLMDKGHQVILKKCDRALLQKYSQVRTGSEDDESNLHGGEGPGECTNNVTSDSKNPGAHDAAHQMSKAAAAPQLSVSTTQQQTDQYGQIFRRYLREKRREEKQMEQREKERAKDFCLRGTQIKHFQSKSQAHIMVNKGIQQAPEAENASTCHLMKSSGRLRSGTQGLREPKKINQILNEMRFQRLLEEQLYYERQNRSMRRYIEDMSKNNPSLFDEYEMRKDKKKRKSKSATDIPAAGDCPTRPLSEIESGQNDVQIENSFKIYSPGILKDKKSELLSKIQMRSQSFSNTKLDEFFPKLHGQSPKSNKNIKTPGQQLNSVPEMTIEILQKKKDKTESLVEILDKIIQGTQDWKNNQEILECCFLICENLRQNEYKLETSQGLKPGGAGHHQRSQGCIDNLNEKISQQIKSSIRHIIQVGHFDKESNKQEMANKTNSTVSELERQETNQIGPKVHNNIPERLNKKHLERIQLQASRFSRLQKERLAQNASTSSLQQAANKSKSSAMEFWEGVVAENGGIPGCVESQKKLSASKSFMRSIRPNSDINTYQQRIKNIQNSQIQKNGFGERASQIRYPEQRALNSSINDESKRSQSSIQNQDLNAHNSLIKMVNQSQIAMSGTLIHNSSKKSLHVIPTANQSSVKDNNNYDNFQIETETFQTKKRNAEQDVIEEMERSDEKYAMIEQDMVKHNQEGIGSIVYYTDFMEQMDAQEPPKSSLQKMKMGSIGSNSKNASGQLPNTLGPQTTHSFAPLSYQSPADTLVQKIDGGNTHYQYSVMNSDRINNFRPQNNHQPLHSYSNLDNSQGPYNNFCESLMGSLRRQKAESKQEQGLRSFSSQRDLLSSKELRREVILSNDKSGPSRPARRNSIINFQPVLDKKGTTYQGLSQRKSPQVIDSRKKESLSGLGFVKRNQGKNVCESSSSRSPIKNVKDKGKKESQNDAGVRQSRTSVKSLVEMEAKFAENRPERKTGEVKVQQEREDMKSKSVFKTTTSVLEAQQCCNNNKNSEVDQKMGLFVNGTTFGLQIQPNTNKVLLQKPRMSVVKIMNQQSKRSLGQQHPASAETPEGLGATETGIEVTSPEKYGGQTSDTYSPETFLGAAINTCQQDSMKKAADDSSIEMLEFTNSSLQPDGTQYLQPLDLKIKRILQQKSSTQLSKINYLTGQIIDPCGQNSPSTTVHQTAPRPTMNLNFMRPISMRQAKNYFPGGVKPEFLPVGTESPEDNDSSSLRSLPQKHDETYNSYQRVPVLGDDHQQSLSKLLYGATSEVTKRQSGRYGSGETSTNLSVSHKVLKTNTLNLNEQVETIDNIVKGNDHYSDKKGMKKYKGQKFDGEMERFRDKNSHFVYQLYEVPQRMTCQSSSSTNLFEEKMQKNELNKALRETHIAVDKLVGLGSTERNTKDFQRIERSGATRNKLENDQKVKILGWNNNKNLRTTRPLGKKKSGSGAKTSLMNSQSQSQRKLGFSEIQKSTSGGISGRLLSQSKMDSYSSRQICEYL